MTELQSGAFRIEHETLYSYTAPVSQSWQLARLTPRELPWQTLRSHQVHIDPKPNELHEVVDGFGNTVHHFGLHAAHRRLRVVMRCEVDVKSRPLPEPDTSSWEKVRDAMRQPLPGGDLLPAQMREPTQLLPWSDAARTYCEPSLQCGRDWLDAVNDLMHRIHRDFDFDCEATTVTTQVDEVLEHRRGVCQDFAHLMLACLRSHGLPARYVSGYLLTDPPEGQARLMGVDATHAWVAAYAPHCGWVEFDPTNDQCADSRYITLAWGADFADVVPLRGVILGGGHQQLKVSVSVIPHAD